jgi:hypothetical protein
MELDMRVYLTDLAGDLHDLRGRPAAFADVYHPTDYAPGQRLAVALRAGGAAGIVYDSVRHLSGECAAAFRPGLLGNCRQERHLCSLWDGEKITAVYEKRALRLLRSTEEKEGVGGRSASRLRKYAGGSVWSSGAANVRRHRRACRGDPRLRGPAGQARG